VRDERVADSNLPHLPALWFIAANSDLEPTERNRVGRRGFAFACIVDYSITVAIDAVGSFVRAPVIVFVHAI
jgi:hypothetical protein